MAAIVIACAMTIVAVPAFHGGSAAAQTTSAEGEYHPVPPQRVLDTRYAIGGSGPLGPGATLNLRFTGVGGIPASGVSAVIANVAVTEPTAASHLTLWPSGQSRPDTSNLNFVAGQIVSNLVTVRLGGQGDVSIFNAAGSTHVVVDVAGWYSTAGGPAGARFTAVTPRRLVDTRTGYGGAGGALGPSGRMDLLMFQGGSAGLPSNATAVVINLAVTQPMEPGHITVFPKDVARPNVSNLNFSAGQIVANLVVVRLSPDGWISLVNSAGTTHLVIDLVGFYGGAKTGDEGRFVALTPARLRDTRNPLAPLPAGVMQVPVAGRGGLPDGPMRGVVLNVTVTQPTGFGHLTVYPTSPFVPDTSTLNYAPGQTVPNLAMVGPINGSVNVANSAGWTHVVIDVFGYFTGPALLGFDTCEVPSVSQMATWKATSPYGVVGIYIGPLPDGPGVRACRNLPLDNPSWVNQVTAQGWRLIPTYVGRQAPCTGYRVRIDPPVARIQGIEGADDAITRATAAGLGPGVPIYFDLEHYDRSAPGCSAAVREFLDGWVDRLQARGYRAGLYSSLLSGIVDHYQSLGQGYTPVDALWIAAWNDTPNIYGFGPYGLPDGNWNQHQRLHQYTGGHHETWGGVTLNIDANVIDGPTAP